MTSSKHKEAADQILSELSGLHVSDIKHFMDNRVWKALLIGIEKRKRAYIDIMLNEGNQTMIYRHQGVISELENFQHMPEYMLQLFEDELEEQKENNVEELIEEGSHNE